MNDLERSGVSDAIEDIRRVLSDTEAPVHDQHLVSRVLLKRFASHSGPDKRKIVPFNLNYPAAKHRAKSPTACGKLLDFAKFGSGYLERQVWKPTEDALPAAFKVLDNGTLFDHPEHVNVIRDAIALHYVRSTQIRDLQRGLWPGIHSDQKAWWLGPGRELLDLGYYRSYGLYPGGQQERERFVDQLLQPWVEAAETELLFDSRLNDLFRRARTLIGNIGLEILTPAHGQFLIGDVPALTVRHDRIDVGVRSGIALGDANSVVLPLGPRHLAALGPANIYGTIPAEAVDRLNSVQIQEADDYVYFQPGSGVEQYIRDRLHLRTLRDASQAS